MKKYTFLIALILIFSSTVWAISSFLSPDDLLTCQNLPSENRPECFSADAIVAVSGGDTTARTAEAIKLYQNGWAPILIFSGAAYDKTGPSNAEVMKKAALEADIPEQDIIVESYGETTKQNAEKTTDILDQQRIRSLILVTSGYHQRRASIEFSKRAPEVNIINHPVPHDKHWPSWWWANPYSWYLAVSELVKIAITSVGISR